ncbi:ABC transporter ATP-binding protein [Leifsonia shinshuensis]|uniref:ABC transporter ATP-binding protein n=1 Tax=Leifsonia shinshuensis TaxID=150026 RepID=UPI0021564EAB|nr:ATP-binding cassette domain-containing protein [Leifsonia shinshuensis]
MVADRLGHSFGASRLFRELSFTLIPGEIIGVCGPSGSGKSTLLSILAGWLAPAEGSISFDRISRRGWVFQNPHGVPRRTALDHVVFPLLAKGFTRRLAEPRAREALGRFALDHVAERKFHQLSGGEAQRLMLARAYCTAPDLLLVDEPTAQLDRATASTVNATLSGIADDGVIVVIATHDADTRRACTRVLDLAHDDFVHPEVVATDDH